MIPNPILKVLSSMRGHRVKCLLMGGQACVFYGGAEFSRDTNLAVLASEENMRNLAAALGDLRAERIAVPGFELDHLLRGHAVHFRCRHPDAAGMRVDVMSNMRGVADFPDLWERRTTIETPEGVVCDLLGLPDLVQAKKTQRDKDWPMIRRLVESHYFQHGKEPTEVRVEFWLRELRTPSLLTEAAGRWRERAAELAAGRPLLTHAIRGDEAAAEKGLVDEENAERARDKEHWQPLIAELEEMRRRNPPPRPS